MVFLENDTFLSELTKLFQKSRVSGTGSVKMTIKKYDGRDRPVPKPRVDTKSKKGKGKAKEPPAPVAAQTRKHHASTSESKTSCLIRAKLHNKKISTVVTSKEINRFQVAYCSLLKGNMDGLKKAKKGKSKAVKATS